MAPDPRTVRKEQWREVGTHSAEAVVALLRLQAATFSIRMVPTQAARMTRAGSPDVPEALTTPLPTPEADEQARKLREVLWGCGHAWFRASREIHDLPPLTIAPALAASYDEDAVGITTLVGGRIPGGQERLEAHMAHVMGEALPVLKRILQSLRGIGDPTLDIVADDLAALIRSIQGPPPPAEQQNRESPAD